MGGNESAIVSVVVDWRRLWIVIVVVLWDSAHILLTFNSTKQSCCLFPYLPLLLRAVVALILRELLGESIFIAVNFDVDPRGLLLLLEVVDVDVDGGESVGEGVVAGEAAFALVFVVLVHVVLVVLSALLRSEWFGLRTLSGFFLQHGGVFHEWGVVP